MGAEQGTWDWEGQNRVLLPTPSGVSKASPEDNCPYHLRAL